MQLVAYSKPKCVSGLISVVLNVGSTISYEMSQEALVCIRHTFCEHVLLARG